MSDLLPVAPAKKTTGHDRGLAGVPEVDFQAPLAKGLASAEAQKQTAHTIAKVNHLNAKQTDGFMDALRGARPDLAGLPFAMGDDCRLKGDRSRELTRAVATVRNALRGRAVASGTVTFTPAVPPPPTLPQTSGTPSQQPVPPPPVPAVPPQAVINIDTGFVANAGGLMLTGSVVADRAPASNFWEQYASACSQEDKQASAVDRAKQENVLIARVAALMQVLAPESPELRIGLVKFLAAVSHVEATRALARLAVFSEEAEVRSAAVAALKVRRERDYTDILLSSLRYPWPAVAARAADALAQLERADLVPQLVELLDEPDPRAPVAKTANGRRVHEARELVRVNHHRNCLLCHAPGNTAGVSPETLTAVVPVPSDPLPSSSDGYQANSPDLSVRIDVTYLRPDFSVMQAVADANPWPEMQRFDFLVRTRVLTEDEAAVRAKVVASEPGRPSPYHRAVLAALRDVTGRDAAPTAEAWRKLLNLPAAARQAARAP
jgi:mono/diheme cytochrome c family protein